MRQSQLSAEITKMRVQVCKAMANPTRMRVIDILKNGEKTAGDLACLLGVPSATLSQHLALLRQVGILESRRDAKFIIYSLTDKRIVDACDLMMKVLLDRIKNVEQLSKSLRKQSAFLKEGTHETTHKP